MGPARTITATMGVPLDWQNPVGGKRSLMKVMSRSNIGNAAIQKAAMRKGSDVR
jgi:hypothetical protein